MPTEKHSDYYYSPSHDLGAIAAKPHECVDGRIMAIVDLGGRAGALWLSNPDAARQLLVAAVEALRILAPDEDPVSKLVADVLEQDEPYVPECGAVCQHDSPCSRPTGHPGDHEVRGSADQFLCSWPQAVNARIDLGDDPDGDNTPESENPSWRVMNEALNARPSVPSSGPLCAKCGSPGPLKTRGNGMQVCEDTGACGRRVQTAGAR